MKYLAQVDRRLFAVPVLASLLFATAACSSGDNTTPAEDSTVEDRGVGLTAQNVRTVCGWETLPSAARPAEDPCAEGEAVVASEFNSASSLSSLNRSGKRFELERASEVCVSFSSPLSAATSVAVNGRTVSGEMRRPDSGHYTMRLEKGVHDLSVLTPSSDAANVSIKATPIRPGQDIVVGESGILELSKVMVDHPMFSPNGDHYHDTALFNANNTPRSLPGEDSGQFDYFLDWKWEVVKADSCESLGQTFTGRTEITAPTSVQALWDGSDSAGASSTSVTAEAVVPDGKYLYRYQATLSRSDGLVIDKVTSRAHTMLVDSTSSRWPSSLGTASSAGSISNSNFIQGCNPSTDSDQCVCPAPSSLPDGTRCTYASVSNLVGFDNPATVPTSTFISTEQSRDDERWKVVVDLREFNGGGLVPQTNGTWQNIGELQDFVSQLTGVPADSSQDRLFNFDYVQLGYSTPVTARGASPGFNHFLLDVITDATGKLTIGSTTYDLPAIFAAGGNATPSKYQIIDDRDGDECYHNGNSDGSIEVEGRSCTKIRTANLDPGNTNIGIYRIETKFFEFMVDGKGTARENHCSSSGCAVRTIQRDAAEIVAEREHFIEEQGEVHSVGEAVTAYEELPALIVETDRDFYFDNQSGSHDGVCSRGILGSYDSIEIPLDSADGALPEVCIINGIL